MEEPTFNAMKVCGRLIPSVVSARSMWHEIPDRKSRIAFMKMSNLFISSENKLFNSDFFLSNCNGLDKEIFQLSSQRNKIIKAQSESMGLNFELYMQSKALVRWHEFVRGDLTCVDIQAELRKTSVRSQIARGLKEWKSWKLKPSKEFFSLVKFKEPELSYSWWLAQEYSLAKSYEVTFVSTSGIISKHDANLNELILKELAIDKKIYSILEKQPPLNYLFQCNFCSRVAIVKQGKLPRHCGSKKCENDYQVERKNVSRPPKTPKGWVPDFSGKPRNCLDCGEKLQVMVGICKGCFRQALQDKA